MLFFTRGVRGTRGWTECKKDFQAIYCEDSKWGVLAIDSGSNTILAISISNLCSNVLPWLSVRLRESTSEI